MELTYDEIWTAMTKSKVYAAALNDPLVKSGLPILAGVLARVDDPEAPIPLRMTEEDVVNGVAAVEGAWFTLHGSYLA